MRDEYLPWTVSARDTEAQRAVQANLRQTGSRFGKNCFVSALAHIYDATLCLGDDSVIGADALIRSARVTTGRNCSINTFAYLQGPITLGDDVRIAPRVSIIADNHNHADVTRSIISQGTSSRGITLGDDIWIGAGAIILDGVTVGSHSIIAAGSVVTRDVPDYVIVGGNPARVIQNRIESHFAPRLEPFLETVRSQVTAVVASHISAGAYTDTSVNQSPVRAWCDAVEILAMFGESSTLLPHSQLVKRLQGMQREAIDYEVLCLGYALEVLGSHVARPYSAAAPLTGATLETFLRGLTWQDNVWGAGHQVDCLATAFYQNQKHFGREPDTDTLFAWLDAHANPETGLWGRGDGMDAVNGFYRLTRGTYAQFARPLPNPIAAINTVLAHANNPAYFAGENGTACNVLDVIHPLWLCQKQTRHRLDEGRRWAFVWIENILTHWNDHAGFSFDLMKRDNPTLMGTEMWLSILYLLCDYVGLAHRLPYRPHGVHRTETALPGVRGDA
jgi:acetyltransferase-like isoleucine patch superfamily enzyme